MGDAITRERVDQRLHDRLLADQVGKLLRPITPGQNRIAFVRGRLRHRRSTRTSLLFRHTVDSRQAQCDLRSNWPEADRR